MIFDSLELFLLTRTPRARNVLTIMSIVLLVVVWWGFGIRRTVCMMRQLERGHIEHERCKQTAACAQDKAKRDIYEHGVRHEIIDKRLSAAGSYKNFLKRCIEYGVEPQNSSISYTAVDGAHCVEIETLLKGSFADWYELLEVLGTEFMIVWKKCVIKPTHDADLEIQAEIALYTK